jgi:REP element-mobilizing transposase RayT
MARKLRINEKGLTYHVWAHGVDDMPLFGDAVAKETAVRLLREEVALSSWSCLEYVVMTTHYHLVLTLREPTLSSGLQRFNMRYAQWFNKTNARRGHAFESRFGCRLVNGDDDQLEAMRYVALNPTRARICRRPEQYPWCGYGATVGLYAPDPLVDLKAALRPVKGSRDAYRAFVEELDPRRRRAHGIP